MQEIERIIPITFYCKSDFKKHLPSETMRCPGCDREVYFAERVSSFGCDWHRQCLKCSRCSKTMLPGCGLERDGKLYCTEPCYNTLFGPRGYGAVPDIDDFYA